MNKLTKKETFGKIFLLFTILAVALPLIGGVIGTLLILGSCVIGFALTFFLPFAGIIRMIIEFFPIMLTVFVLFSLMLLSICVLMICLGVALNKLSSMKKRFADFDLDNEYWQNDEDGQADDQCDTEEAIARREAEEQEKHLQRMLEIRLIKETAAKDPRKLTSYEAKILAEYEAEEREKARQAAISQNKSMLEELRKAKDTAPKLERDDDDCVICPNCGRSIDCSDGTGLHQCRKCKFYINVIK